MSILLSGYYPEGIVFAADKNATITYRSGESEKRHVEPTATKVLSWPRRKAVVGFVGLGMLANYTLDEWMRTFIAGTRDFENFSALAEDLRTKIQNDFDKDFPGNADVRDAHLIIHLGGFTKKDNLLVPVMYHIWNHNDIDPKTGRYPLAERTFRLSEDIEASFRKWSHPEDYPVRIRQRLQR